MISGWNGLAIGALARAGARLGVLEWITAAGEAAAAVLRCNRGPDGRLVRTSLDGIASSAAATASDLALLADGLFALSAANGTASWAVEARALLDGALAGATGDPLLAAQGVTASPDQTDGDLPSGPAAVALAALSAWWMGAGDRYREAASGIVRDLAARSLAQPFAHGSLLRAAAALAVPPRQVVTVAEDRESALARASLTVDADVIAVVTPVQARAFSEAGFELFDGKGEIAERVYDCRSFVCLLPLSDSAELVAER